MNSNLKEVRKQHMWVSGGRTFQGASLLFKDARKPGWLEQRVSEKGSKR